MLQPNRVKYRKMQRQRHSLGGAAHAGITVAFGQFGMQAVESAEITARQIEAVRRAITHELRRGGDVYVRIFPDKPVSKKPQETRMGSGKAPVDHWVAVVKRGRIMFEVGGVTEDLAKEAMRLASHKLPIDVRFIVREVVAKKEAVAAAAAATESEGPNVKVEEIRAQGLPELVKQLDAAHQELFNLRFRLATKQLVNHRELPRVRTRIAQIETIIKQKQLESRQAGK